MQTAEDGVNGVNGAEGDLEMANAEEQTTLAAGLTAERQPNTVRITTPYLTKYERARILGTRALQIRFYFFAVLYCQFLNQFVTV
jgi:DNA-directed RNA polymerase I, II, and III subunit RPABC2